jgi:hypothetical protein
VAGFGNRPGQRPPDDVVQFGSSRERRWPWLARFVRRRWLPLLVPVAMIAVVAIASTTGHSRKHHQGVTVTQAGHRLLGVRAGWQILARGPDAVVVIQPARGRVTRTTVPALDSTGPVYFLAERAAAVIRPLDEVPGYLVPSGRPARSLPLELRHGGPVFPGPRPGQVWVSEGSGAHLSMSLAWLDGRQTGHSVPVPGGGSLLVAADGRGYLLLSGATGVWDARPGRLRHVTAGTVVAAGPAGWLAVDCLHGNGCFEQFVDSSTMQRRLISTSPVNGGDQLGGVISPAGTVAAVFRGHRGRVGLYLVDLGTGVARPVPVPVDQDTAGFGDVAWSPDSRWLFVAAHGKLLAVDARTDRVRGLGVSLPEVSQVTIGR